MRVMRHMRALVLAFLSAGLVFGTLPAQAADLNEAAVKAAIERADAARKKADSVGGEWRDTKKLLDQANAALAKGDLEAAMKLADEAEYQGERGYHQAMSQERLEFPAFMR